MQKEGQKSPIIMPYQLKGAFVREADFLDSREENDRKEVQGESPSKFKKGELKADLCMGKGTWLKPV